jgi:transcriptional regulator with XRE-family HTH domain
MKLGEILKKERERKKITIDDVAGRLGIGADEYREMEGGNTAAEEWGPRLALTGIKLQVPTSRLISETGKSKQARRAGGQCGKLIRAQREKRDITIQELADKIEVPLSQMASIEDGGSLLEHYAPLLLAFAEVIDQPIFNLFYPCGLPLDKLTDYS